MAGQLTCVVGVMDGLDAVQHDACVNAGLSGTASCGRGVPDGQCLYGGDKRASERPRRAVALVNVAASVEATPSPWAGNQPTAFGELLADDEEAWPQ